jgi:hypothetical protein
LAKLRKYYNRLDTKPGYLLALAIHPYFKLVYIGVAWGAAEDQEAEQAAGNPFAKNWQDEVLQVLERTVSNVYLSSMSPVFHAQYVVDAEVLEKPGQTSNQTRHRITHHV